MHKESDSFSLFYSVIPCLDIVSIWQPVVLQLPEPQAMSGSSSPVSCSLKISLTRFWTHVHIFIINDNLWQWVTQNYTLCEKAFLFIFFKTNTWLQQGMKLKQRFSFISTQAVLRFILKQEYNLFAFLQFIDIMRNSMVCKCNLSELRSLSQTSVNSCVMVMFSNIMLFASVQVNQNP